MSSALLLRFARLSALAGMVALFAATGERGIVELPGRLVEAVVAPIRGPIDDAPIADLLFAVAGLLAVGAAVLAAARSGSERLAVMRGGVSTTRAPRPEPDAAPPPVTAPSPSPDETPATEGRLSRWRRTLIERREDDPT